MAPVNGCFLRDSKSHDAVKGELSYRAVLAHPQLTTELPPTHTAIVVEKAGLADEHGEPYTRLLGKELGCPVEAHLCISTPAGLWMRHHAAHTANGYRLFIVSGVPQESPRQRRPAHRQIPTRARTIRD
jgi:hypothetical protein